MKFSIKNPFSSKSNKSKQSKNPSKIKPFKPTKKLCDRDTIIINMLNRDSVSLCITDPELDDNAIVYISPGFLKLTGYGVDDVVGKNCR